MLFVVHATHEVTLHGAARSLRWFCFCCFGESGCYGVSILFGWEGRKRFLHACIRCGRIGGTWVAMSLLASIHQPTNQPSYCIKSNKYTWAKEAQDSVAKLLFKNPVLPLLHNWMYPIHIYILLHHNRSSPKTQTCTQSRERTSNC